MFHAIIVNQIISGVLRIWGSYLNINGVNNIGWVNNIRICMYGENNITFRIPKTM